MNSDVVIILSESWGQPVDIKRAYRLAKTRGAAPSGTHTTVATKSATKDKDKDKQSAKNLTIVRVVAKNTIEEHLVRKGGSISALQGTHIKDVHSEEIARMMFRYALTYAKNSKVLGLDLSEDESNGQQPSHTFTVLPTLLALAPPFETDKVSPTDAAAAEAGASSKPTESTIVANKTRSGLGIGKGKGVIVLSGGDTGNGSSVFRRRNRGAEPSRRQRVTRAWVSLMSELMLISENSFESLARAGELVEPKGPPPRQPLPISSLAKVNERAHGGNGPGAIPSGSAAALAPAEMQSLCLPPSDPEVASWVWGSPFAAALGLDTSGARLQRVWNSDSLIDLVMALSGDDGGEEGVGGTKMTRALLVQCSEVVCANRSQEDVTVLRTPVQISHDDSGILLKSDGVGSALAEHVAWSLRQAFSLSEERVRDAAKLHAEDLAAAANRSVSAMGGGLGGSGAYGGTASSLGAGAPGGSSGQMPAPLPALEAFRTARRLLKRKGMHMDPHLMSHPLQVACKADVVYTPSAQEKVVPDLNVKVRYRSASARPQRRTNKIQSRVDAKRRQLDVPLQVELAGPELERAHGTSGPHSLRGSYSARPIFIPSRPPKPLRETEIHNEYEKWTPEEDETVVSVLAIFGPDSWALAEYVLNSRPSVWGRVRSARQIRDRHALLESNNLLDSVREKAKNLEASIRATLAEINREPDIEGLTSWLVEQQRRLAAQEAVVAAKKAEEKPPMSTEDAVVMELAAAGVEALTEDVKKEEDNAPEDEAPQTITSGTGKTFESASAQTRKLFAGRRGAIMEVMKRRPPSNFISSYRMSEGSAISQQHPSHSEAVQKLQPLSALSVIGNSTAVPNAEANKPPTSSVPGQVTPVPTTAQPSAGASHPPSQAPVAVAVAAGGSK